MVSSPMLRALALFGFWIPVYVAYRRTHRNRLAILWANIFLGVEALQLLAHWSNFVMIAWMALVVWASTCNVERRVVAPAPLPKREIEPATAPGVIPDLPPLDA